MTATRERRDADTDRTTALAGPERGLGGGDPGLGGGPAGAGAPAAADDQGAAGGRWRRRVASRVELDPRDLLAHPANYKAHPDRQVTAIGSAIAEVGWIGEVYVSARTMRILDGHMRVAEAIRSGQPSIPVALIDCADEAEELAILATFDPIGQMALVDAGKVADLAARARISADPLRQMLAGLAGTRPPEPTEGPGGRVIGSSFGPQGGNGGGHLGKVSDLVYPVVIECEDQLEQDRLLMDLTEEGHVAYTLDPSPSAVADRE